MDLFSLQVDPFERLFYSPDGLPTLPLPPEEISKVIIIDKAPTQALTQTQRSLTPLTPDPAAASESCFLPWFDPNVDQSTENRASSLNALTASGQTLDEFQTIDPNVARIPADAPSSAQSSVTYSKVLLSDAKQDQQPAELHFRDGSRSSSSDEGNFSANNSDISESAAGGLWELDSCPGAEADDPRRSCSYNSVEELSETSEQEDEGAPAEQGKHLCYLELKYPESEESEEDGEEREEEAETELLQTVLSREDCVELHPLLSSEGSGQTDKLLAASAHGFSSLYLPQYRTDACTRQFHTHDSQP